jgi:nucleotide-binding universal stress UspA family protein
MSSNRRGPPRVVVGYDASVSAQVVVGRAADEAERRGLPLSVVHVVDDACRVGGPAAGRPGPAGVSLAQARRIATGGAALARTGHPGLEVRARTLVGSPGTVLVRESEGAALVVVGARGRPRHLPAGTARTGSASTRCTIRTTRPVPLLSGWPPGRPRSSWWVAMAAATLTARSSAQ